MSGTTKSDEVVARNGEVIVTVGGWPDEPEKTETQPLAVHKFVTEPAHARVGLGITINIGNYQSVKAEVTVDLPCYREQMNEALERAQKIAMERVSLVCEDARERTGKKEIPSFIKKS